MYKQRFEKETEMLLSVNFRGQRSDICADGVCVGVEVHHGCRAECSNASRLSVSNSEPHALITHVVMAIVRRAGGTVAVGGTGVRGQWQQGPGDFFHTAHVTADTRTSVQHRHTDRL